MVRIRVFLGAFAAGLDSKVAGLQKASGLAIDLSTGSIGFLTSGTTSFIRLPLPVLEAVRLKTQTQPFAFHEPVSQLLQVHSFSLRMGNS